MNDIAKKATTDRFLKALEKEGLSKSIAGSNIGLTPVHVSYLFNEKYWSRLGEYYWGKVLDWANSGYSLNEYPKHHPEAALKPKAEIDPVAAGLWQKTVDNVKTSERIAEVFPASEPEIDYDQIKKKFQAEAIKEFINNNSTKVITRKNRSFYFMPFWFLNTETDRLELYSLGNLPEDLKEAINLLRSE